MAEEEVSTVLDYALQDPTWSFESKKEAVTQLSEVLKNTRLLASVVISLAQLFLSSNRPLQAVRILEDNIQVSSASFFGHFPDIDRFRKCQKLSFSA